MSKRTPIVAGNWKMNTTVAEGLALVDGVMQEIGSIRDVDLVICPPFVSLWALEERLRGTGLKLGAQNAHFESKGAFTGEISPSMLAGIVDYVIVGHSERRHFFGETDEVVARKLNAVIAHGLLPILCVGETLAERESGATENVLQRQVQLALDGIKRADGLVVAYEPVWAIGTGLAATADDANAVISLIRRQIGSALGEAVADATRIQYGGSVTSSNAKELLSQPEIDGALVGGASLNASSFAAIIRAAANA